MNINDTFVLLVHLFNAGWLLVLLALDGFGADGKKVNCMQFVPYIFLENQHRHVAVANIGMLL